MRAAAGLVALALAGTASAAAADFDAVAVAPAHFDAIARHVPGASGLHLREVTDVGHDGALERNTVLISRATLTSLRSARELDGLLAVLIAAMTSDSGEAGADGDHPNIGDYLGLAAYAATARIVDPIDSEDQQDRARRNYDFSGASTPKSQNAGTPRGRRILRLIRASGSCSGATLDALDRLGEARTRSPLAYLAGDLRHAFGALAMPPDRSCGAG